MYWNFDEIIVRPNAPRLAADEKPLAVEIGFGNGEYLAHLARTRPDWLVLGIEVSQWCIAKAARRALAEGLKNVRILHGDARHLLRLAFAPRSISDVFMNFPCPWPKRRHTERRVARPQFAALMAESLREGGRFTLATDVDWYAAETFEVFSADDGFRAEAVQKNPGRDYATKYERKWLEMGRDTYVMTATKTGGENRAHDTGIDTTENDEILEMATEISGGTDGANGSKNFRDLILSVKGDVLESDAYKVIFREVFFAEDDAAVVLVIAVDEGFEQHYYLKLIPTNGRVKGKVDAVGHPYKTPGVRASLRHLMKKIGARF